MPPPNIASTAVSDISHNDAAMGAVRKGNLKNRSASSAEAIVTPSRRNWKPLLER
jgi:hypothetical protein